jgi:hypothetical protein
MSAQPPSNPYLPHTLNGETLAVRPGRDDAAPEPQAAVAPKQQQPARSAAVTGTTAEVLSWVGGDYGRAEAALRQELDRKNPRVTLVAALESILDTPRRQGEGMDVLREKLGLLR